MKLELKHLAPYLPYELNTQFTLGYVVKDIHISKAEEVRNKQLKPECVDFVLEYCKLILRPLSDLKSGKFSDNIISQSTHAEILKLNTCHWISYHSFQYLLENHFDVFGLIEKGLAIDINTLNK